MGLCKLRGLLSFLIFFSAPSTPGIFVKDYTNIGNRNSWVVTFQLASMSNEDDQYLVSVTPSLQECVNSSVCVITNSDTLVKLTLSIEVEYTVSIRAERCNGSLKSGSAELRLKLPGIIILII